MPVNLPGIWHFVRAAQIDEDNNSLVSPSLRAGGDQCLGSSGQAESECSRGGPGLWVLFKPSTDWRMLTQTREGDWLYQPSKSKAGLIWKQPHRHAQVCLPKYPGALWCWQADRKKCPVIVTWLLYPPQVPSSFFH